MALDNSRRYSEYEGKEAVDAILALSGLRPEDARPITDKGSVFAKTGNDIAVKADKIANPRQEILTNNGQSLDIPTQG